LAEGASNGRRDELEVTLARAAVLEVTAASHGWRSFFRRQPSFVFNSSAIAMASAPIGAGLCCPHAAAKPSAPTATSDHGVTEGR
jgi:hypothetical protein